MPGSSLTFRILGDADSAVKAMRRTHSEAEKATSGIRSSFKKLVGFSMGLAAVGGVGAFFKDAIAEASNYNRAVRQTTSVLASTGHAAHLTGDDVASLAEKISGITAINKATIQSGENLLLTFTNIRNEAGKGNDIFNQTTQIMTDMSVALGEDTKTAAIQLGKALNDPIRGVSTLRRVGVAFTSEQQDQIKALVASGHAMDAQKLILRELTREFGGSAAAQATSGAKLKNAVAELEEEVGQALLPVIKQLTVFLTDYVVPAFSETFHFIQRNATEIKVIGGVVLGMWAAWKGYTIVKAAAAWLALASARYQQFVAQLSYGNRVQRGASSGLQFVGGNIGKVTAIAGASAIVIADVVKGWQSYEAAQRRVQQTTSDLTKAILADSGALGKHFQAQVTDTLQSQGLVDIGLKAGVSQEVLTKAFLGNADALRIVNKAMGDYVANGPGDGRERVNNFNKVRVALIDFNGEQSNAEKQAKRAAASTKELAAAQTKGADSGRSLKAAMAATNAELAKQHERMQQAITDTLELTNSRLGEKRAELQFKDGLASLSATAKENGRSLDVTTKAGRANREALIDQLSALQDVASSQAQNGKSLPQVARAWFQNERALRKAAAAAGYNKDQVDKLFGSLERGTRHRFRVALDADLSKAKAQLAAYKVWLREQRFIISVDGRVSLRGGVRPAGYASGTGGASPGWRWVGERGPELMRFKGGEQVLSHPASMQVSGGYAKGTPGTLHVAGGRLELGRGSAGELRAWVEDIVLSEADHSSTIGRMR